MDHDLLVVSINGAGAPGNLNRSVMKRAGYSEAERPSEGELRSGYFLLHREAHKPILFIVVDPEGNVHEQLPYNLHNGLLSYRADMAGKRVWLPLLGTGAGRLAFGESLRLTISAIESVMNDTPTEPPLFSISVPGSEEGLSLLRELGIEPSSPATDSAQEGGSDRGYWIIKMGLGWKEEQLKEDEPIFFRPVDYSSEVISETVVHGMAPGDRALAFLSGVREHPESYDWYPGDYLWCEMEVESQIETAASLGIRMKVTHVFYRPIPRHQVEKFIPGHETIFGGSAAQEGFFPISEDSYTAILALEERPFVNRLLPFYLTEGNHRETHDQLGFDADIDAFAAVIRQEAVKPPLAIGLFGNWGSGKSFFMEKLEERIADKTRWNYPEYVQHIVPVRFNSWHYSDANLWASMITHIFKSLTDYANDVKAPPEAIQAIYRNLNLTKEQLEEADKAVQEKQAEADAVAAQKSAVETELTEKRSTLKLWKTKELARAVFDDPTVQEDIALLNQQFDTAGLQQNLVEIRKRRDDLRGAIGQLREAWKAARKYSKGKWLVVWLVVVIVGLACLAVYLLFRRDVQDVIDNLTTPVAILVTGLSGLFLKLSPYLEKARSLYENLRDLAQRIEKKKSQLEVEKEAKIVELEQSISALDAEKAALAVQRDEIKAKKTALEEELRNIGSGKLLAGFLAGRSTDDAYLQQLGIISRIRKDFEQLNRHFEEQLEARRAGLQKDKPHLQIDRIVLYIDDLDRCNEEVVVKVLEAIHLLLAFPLFVVVVGVDPRWLNNALTEKYKLLFGSKSSRGGQEGQPGLKEKPQRGAATSYDYLEKIFQIPFALRPVTKEGREKLIRYLAEDRKIPAATGNEELSAVGDFGETAGETQEYDEKDSSSGTTQEEQQSEQATLSLEEIVVEEADKKALQNPRVKLTISAGELAYMQQLSSLFAETPRTVNRYVNIYRIIKAHGGLQVVGPYEQDEFLPILFLLAVVVGYPESADEFLQRVDATEDTQKCSEFLQNCGIEPLRARSLEAVGALGEMHMLYLKKNLPLVARFSFRTLMQRMN